MVRVFLSYARQDEAQALRLYHGLVARQLDVWMDNVHMKPGAWQPQILRAISQSRYFIACMSRSSLAQIENAEGYQETELGIAYKIAMDQSPDRFAIIPVRLEKTDRGDHRLSTFHQYDLYKDGFDAVLDRLAEAMGGRRKAAEETSLAISDRELAVALHGKAVVFFELGKYDKSLALLLSVEQLGCETFVTRSDTAAMLNALERYADALIAIDSALALNSNESPLWFNKGVILVNLDRYDEAEFCVRRALELNPKSADAWLKLGFLIFRTGNAEAALDAIAHALRHDPAHARAHTARALVLEQLQREDEALQDAEKAVSLDPNLAQAHELAGALLCRSGRFDQAVVRTQRALELNPRLNRAHAIMVETLIAMDRLDEADRAVDRALAVLPDHVVRHHRACLDAWKIAIGLRKLGREAEAANVLLEILEEEANHLGETNALITAMGWTLVLALGSIKPFAPGPHGKAFIRWNLWLKSARPENLTPLHRRVLADVEKCLGL